MKLINTVNNIPIKQPNFELNYLKFENSIESDSSVKNLNLKLVKKTGEVQTFKNSTKVENSKKLELKTNFGINTKKIIEQALFIQEKLETEEIIFNKIQDLGKSNKIAKLPTKWYDIILLKIFKYEKIRNVKNINSYLSFISNLLVYRNRIKKPNYIIVGHNLLHELKKYKSYRYIDFNDMEENTNINQVGTFLDYIVFLNPNMSNDEILFGTFSDNINNFLNYIELENSKKIIETYDNNDDTIYELFIRKTLFETDNAYTFFLYDKIHIGKRNFWTFVINKLKLKLK